MKKRIIAFVLASILCLNLSLTAFASQADTTQYQYVDDSVVYIEPWKYDLATQETAIPATLRDANTSVSYSYTMERCAPSEKASASVTLIFSLNTGSDVLSAQATGTINSYSLSDGRVLWDGMLDGKGTCGDSEYIVLVSFSKFDDTETIQANVTVQTNNEIISMFSFGETIQSESLFAQIEKSEQLSAQSIPDDLSLKSSALATSGYTPIVSNATSYTIGSNTREVLTTTAFFEPINNRCLINLQSNTKMMKELFSNAYSVDMKKVSCSLLYDSSKENPELVGNNVANIIGFWGVSQLTSYEPESDGSYYVESLFSAVLKTAFDYFCGSFLPLKLDSTSFIPISSDIASTVKSLFSTATGYVTKDFDTTYHTLTIDYGNKTGLHYDDCGMPTVFVIGAGPNFNSGQSAYYTASTSITYRITTNGGGTAPGTRFYITVSGGLDSFGLPVAA